MSDPSRPFVIDSDAHVIEPPGLWKDYLKARFRVRAPRPIVDERGGFCYDVDGTRIMRTAAALGPSPEARKTVRLRPGGWDPKARLRDMDTEGVDLAVLYPSLAFFFPELPDPELHAALCRAYNDWLADHCRHAPERLIGIALLPLDDVAASIQELERATSRLGFRGAFFRPNPYAGRVIQDPAYDPFWDCARSLGVPITVHEGISDSLPTLGRERTPNPAFQHLMSHPFEQMAACAGLILGGVLERFPDLSFVFLESGCGWLPYWLERMDGHWKTWGWHLPEIKRPPSELFKRQCFVSMDTDDAGARFTLESVGDENLVWASDYPHLDATFPGAVEETLEILREVPDASRRKVLGGNARRLYGLTLP
ncbi:MAG: amidohydrolase family protein [Myxococcota bacterium]